MERVSPSPVGPHRRAGPMRVVATKEELRRALQALPRPLGFVPTMGYLHEGHLALVRRARRENASVAVSIFVNPTQFGPHEDYRRYPRDLERDLALLGREGVDLVFTPSPEEMYPAGFQTWVEPGPLARPLEGACRPGHFRGVCTVVLKLFNLFRPERAYFGEKDAQQLRVVRRMALDLDTGVEVVPVATVREPDGLALSSRNVYLSPPERRAATALYRALEAARSLYEAGERDAEALREAMRAVLRAEPLIARVDYVSVADAETLEELERVDRPALLSLAARIGQTRLIDNLTVGG